MQPQTLGTNSIDPTALQLSRAIRQAETGGNYTLNGKSGEKGAYQWMPGNFESGAKKYGLDPNDFSETNQDHVAYEQIKEQLDKGYSQSQVASWWNSGKYDPTGNVGTNSQGVAYNTPAYVDRVKQYYANDSQPQTSGQFVNPNVTPQSNSQFVTPPPVQNVNQSDNQQNPSFLGLQQGAQSIPAKIADWYTHGVGKTTGEAIGTLGGLGYEKLKGLVGGQDNSQFYDTSAPSPLQVAGDVAQGAAAVGGLSAGAPASILGGAGIGAGLGALSAAGGAAKQTSGSAIPTGEDIKQVGKQGLIGGAIGGVLGGATTWLGQLISKSGDKILNTAIKPNARDYADGFDLGTLKKYNINGNLATMANKTESTMNDLTQKLNETLANSGEEVQPLINLQNPYEKTVSDLTGNKLRGFGQNASIQRAIQQLGDELSNVSDDGALTVPQAQILKQASGKMGAWQFGMGDPDASAKEAVYNAFYHNLKTEIEDNSPEGVRSINQEISKLIPISNAIIRRIPVAERNAALSIGDIMTGIASIFDPRQLLGFGISLAQKEARAGGLLNTVGPKVSELAPLVGSLAGSSVTSGTKLK